MVKLLYLIVSLVVLGPLCQAQQSFIAQTGKAGDFPLFTGRQAADIIFDEQDDSLVKLSATLFAEDVFMVSGKQPKLSHAPKREKFVVVIGTIGKSALLKQLVAQNRAEFSRIKGHWDAYQMQVVNNPFPGVAQALVIAGANKRGAAYGVFELSRQMGVSPWYWWADVPVKKKQELYIKAPLYFNDAPKVKYRGFFINDEAPAFSGWTKEKFGGVNHLVYEKVFELLLRLKANYLWPAMWGNAFNDDDTLNPVLADKWGIVMGTSHHEPMLRAQKEWKRYGTGPWDYTKNDSVLRAFWRKGIEHMGRHESIVTVGMRGDGDMPMTQGTAKDLLERIVADQRKIIAEVTGKPAQGTPQLWALYKEVQDYYDQGMRVPDDVTLLLSDDNWGNLRRLPRIQDHPRKGGYGIYYHFDYVGGPRNYKWINTNNIARVWEQMHLAYSYGVRQIWIVNVGDIKPMEFPISFFMDYAWNPDRWNASNLREYYTLWASAQFGAKMGKEIGDIMRLYAQIVARRKPELLDAGTYSIEHYGEAQRVTNVLRQLAARAGQVNQMLPEEARDAFFELVLHPVLAYANLMEMYEAVAFNHFYAAHGNSLANEWADKAKAFYLKDSLLSVQYNKQLAGGKWDHMMDQVHIGYTRWNDPPVNHMPALTYVTASNAAQTAAVDETTQKTAASLIPTNVHGTLFYETDGYVSMEAEDYSRRLNSHGITWTVITDIGKTGSGLSPFPVTAAFQRPGADDPHVEYDFYVYDTGQVKVQAYFSPTLNFLNLEKGLQYGVSVDEEAPQIVSIDAGTNEGQWNSWVANNIIIRTTTHKILQPGKHTLKFWMVNAGIVLQKLVVDLGGVKQSYLGPPETVMKK